MNIKSNDNIGENKDPKANVGSSYPTKYQNLSSKIETTYPQDNESLLWDKRFIEYSK